jgi:hypothetical protein
MEESPESFRAAARQELAKLAADNLQLRHRLRQALEDHERMEWVIATINRVGTLGFACIVSWDTTGLTREDIDLAREKQPT